MLMESWMEFFSKLATLLSKKTSFFLPLQIEVERISHQDSSQLTFACQKSAIETLENGSSTASTIDFEQINVSRVADIGDRDK